MAIKELTIYVAECDGCGAEVTANEHNEPFWEEGEVQDEAQERGWVFTPYEDLCRECRGALGDPPRARHRASDAQDEEGQE